jgi:hypothetical protein
MSKGQSQVIQFILFFMIGMAIFLSIGGLFRGRVDIFADDIAAQNRKMLNSYFSALIVKELVTCKGCDNINITTRLSNTTAGAFTQIALNNTHLTTITQPGADRYWTTAHNLTLSLTAAGGLQISSKPIIISYNKTQNILRILP